MSTFERAQSLADVAGSRYAEKLVHDKGIDVLTEDDIVDAFLACQEWTATHARAAGDIPDACYGPTVSR